MKHTTIIFSLLILIACNNEQNIKKTDLKPIIQEENKLELNNNKQWKVVPDMMNYLQFMKEDVGKFEGKTMEEYQELSTDLLINVDLLTANCTMKGEAHDQLHLWLVPYIGLVNDFAKAENKKEAERILIELQKSFNKFDKYFK